MTLAFADAAVQWIAPGRELASLDRCMATHLAVDSYTTTVTLAAAVALRAEGVALPSGTSDEGALAVLRDALDVLDTSDLPDYEPQLVEHRDLLERALARARERTGQ